MSFIIKDPAIEGLARQLAERTGETVAIATRKALEERLRRVGAPYEQVRLAEDLAAIRQRWATLPVIGGRLPDEIVGYDEDGLPH